MKDLLTDALLRRKDRQALEIIKEHPELIDESVIRLALDHGCVKVIRYLREHDKITAEGSLERQKQREDGYLELLDELDRYMPDLEKIFE